MKLNGLYRDFEAQLNQTRASMQDLDQSDKDLNREPGAISIVTGNGDTFESSTNEDGFYSYAATLYTRRKAALWKTTEALSVELEEKAESIKKTVTTETISSFRWLPMIKTSKLDKDVFDAQKYLPY